MFGIGMQELLLIFVVAMIVLGPKKLPELAKTLGKAAREFKKASNDLKQAIGLDENESPPAPDTKKEQASESSEDQAQVDRAAQSVTEDKVADEKKETADKQPPREYDHAGC